MRSSAHYLRHSLAAAICLALAPMAFAAAPEVSSESESITVGSEAPAYTLRLSYPDGRTSERVLLSGETFAIDAMSPGGQLADGIYQFEAQPITGLRERSGMDADAEIDKSIDASMPSESGSFRVHQGRIVVAKAEPNHQGDQDFGVRMKDQVISDDLIVNNGSLCVGQDCVNGENFGFDTLRLKENNLRLHFDDTSNSGSFPNNDWTLVANDSANGGANYFAVEDRSAGRRVFEVRAGAPANSLFIDASGRIGIKTSTPVVNIHVAEGNTPALRLEQNGSSGFTAQTWDIAGNETNFFVRDVTNGSRLPFKIRPGAPTDSLYVAADGKVGLGTANPSSSLTVASSGGSGQIKIAETSSTVAGRDLVRLENNGPTRLVLANTSTSNIWNLNANDSEFRIGRVGSGITEFVLDQTGNLSISGTLSQGSDVNSKENFVSADSGETLKALLSLPVTRWNYKGDPDSVTHMGPTAQDFYAQFKLGAAPNRISTLDGVGVSFAAIQGLWSEIQKRDQRLNELEEMVIHLSNQLEKLEKGRASTLD